MDAKIETEHVRLSEENWSDFELSTFGVCSIYWSSKKPCEPKTRANKVSKSASV